MEIRLKKGANTCRYFMLEDANVELKQITVKIIESVSKYAIYYLRFYATADTRGKSRF